MENDKNNCKFTCLISKIPTPVLPGSGAALIKHLGIISAYLQE